MQDNNDQILDDKARMEIPVDFNRPDPGWKKFFGNKAILFAIVAALALVGAIAWYFLGGMGDNGPQAQNVILTITGPDELMSGNEAEYKISYINGENADMISISLEVFYPSGFTFRSASANPLNSAGTAFNLSPVQDGQKGELTIRGKLSGSTGETKQVKGILRYRLSNFNSSFVLEQAVNTAILPPNLTMDVNGPVDVVNGQDTTFTVTFTNITQNDFENMALEIVYPEGYIFTESTPPVTRNNNYWAIQNLASNSSVSIDITGSFTGQDAETKLIRADLGQIINNSFAVQMTSTATFRIIPSSLTISLTSDVEDGVVRLGDSINYTISYANRGRIGLNNISIEVTLEGTSLDMQRISATDAIVTGRTLSWKAATIPGLSVLSPNERGEIRFSVQLLSNLTSNIKNQTIKTSGIIYSQENTKPTKAPDVITKLGSSLELAVSGDYLSGAAPMKVGSSTLFEITFMLSNFSNDLTGARVVSSMTLPASAWKNVIMPDSEKGRLSYDANSGRITWDIGDLPAFTGRFTPVRQVTFYLEVTPTEADRGKVMNLLSNIQANGVDSFTTFELESDRINTFTVNDLNDDVLGNAGTTVQ